jgi:hypothetical protein
VGPNYRSDMHRVRSNFVRNGVVEPHNFDAAQAPGKIFDAAPAPAPTSRL